MIQSDLARLMKVGKVTVGGLIDRLEASGQVERRPDAADRRLKRLFITDRGYQVIAQMGALRDELNAVILKGLPREQVRLTEVVMQTMKDNMRHALGDLEDDVLANADH
jgi:DNA-binding MarR family transcriptional regulator